MVCNNIDDIVTSNFKQFTRAKPFGEINPDRDRERGKKSEYHGFFNKN